MKLIFLLIITYTTASAQLMRNTPFEGLFDDSDTVFVGHSIIVQATGPQGIGANGKLAPRDWVIVFSIVSGYKGDLLEPTVELRIPSRSALWGMPAAPGMNWLVFARRNVKTLTLVNDQAMLPFWESPKQSANGLMGLARMEDDLLTVGTGSGPNSGAALEMLFRFTGLSKQSLGVLRSFDTHGRDETEVLRLELVAREGSPEDVERLLALAAERNGETLPASTQLFSIILQKTSVTHLPVLERLCESNFGPFRRGSYGCDSPNSGREHNTVSCCKTSCYRQSRRV